VDPATLIGMGIALGALLVTMLLEGSSPLAIFLLPPLLLVFGATLGAAMAGSTTADLRRLGRWLRLALTPTTLPTLYDHISTLVDLAGKARREGLLALDREIAGIRDPFLRSGLRLAIDGMTPEHLQTVMEGEIAARTTEERVAARFFGRMGGYAPTIGIIGTVVGLIQVLANLQDMETIGPAIAGAFVATLWGVMSANFIWLPIGGRLGKMADLQAERFTVLTEGVMAVQSGTQPRVLGEKLRAMVPASQLAKPAEKSTEKAAKPAKAAKTAEAAA
jgi:chemotaxis protein MotA